MEFDIILIYSFVIFVIINIYRKKWFWYFPLCEMHFCFYLGGCHICCCFFFTWSFSLEFVWYYISSAFQDFSQYSSRSRQRCNLDLLKSSSFSTSTDYNYDWHDCYRDVPQVFQFSGKVQIFVKLFTFLHFLWSAGTAKCTRWQVSFFLSIKTKYKLNNLFVSQSSKESDAFLFFFF